MVDNYKKVKLKTGAITDMRGDGAMWIDDTKGYPGKKGWYYKTGDKAPDTYNASMPFKSDDDIIRQMGFDPKYIKNMEGYYPGKYMDMLTKPGSTEQKVMSAQVGIPGIASTSLGGLLQGARETYAGARQLAARIPYMSTPAQQTEDLLSSRIRKWNYENMIEPGMMLPTSGAAGQALAKAAKDEGNLGAGMKMVPTGIPGYIAVAQRGGMDVGPLAGQIVTNPLSYVPVGKVASKAGRVVANVGLGAGMGGMAPTYATTPEQAAEIQNRNIQMGAITGGLVPLAAEYLPRAGMGAREAMKRAAFGTPEERFGAGPAMNSALYRADAIEREGIQPSVADVIMDPIKRARLRSAETQLAKVPLSGMPEYMVSKNVAAQEAAARRLAQVTPELEGLSPAQAVGKSVSGKMRELREHKNALYEPLIEGAKGVEPEYMNTIKAIDQHIADLEVTPSYPGKEAALTLAKSRRADFMRDLGNRNRAELVGTLQDQGFDISPQTRQLVEQNPPIENPYEYMKRHRSRLGEEERAARGVSAVDEAKAIKQVKAATADLGIMAKRAGLEPQQEEANRFFRETWAPRRAASKNNPYHREALIISDVEAKPEAVFEAIDKAKTPAQLKYWYDTMDKKGHEAVKAHMLDRVISDATTDAEGKLAFDTGRASGKLAEYGKVVDAFGDPEFRQQVRGLRNLFDALTPPSQTIPSKGVRIASGGALAGLGLGAGFGLGPAGVAGVAMTPVVARKLTTMMTTPKGREVLLRAAQIGSNTKAAQAFARKYGAYIAAKMALSHEEVPQLETVQPEPTQTEE